MKYPKFLIQTVALAACMLCSMSAAAQEAYACYTSENHTLTFYYDSNRPNRTGTIYDLNSGSNAPGWYNDGTYLSVMSVVFKSSFTGARPTSTYKWFAGMENLTNSSFTGLNYLKTENVTNMSGMFYECSELTNIDAVVSYLNTAIVTNMDEMFYGCASLTSLDLNGFITTRLENMSRMFKNCYSLESINLSSFNTARVTNMQELFYGCSGLTTLDLSNFNTAKVANMCMMFNGCSELVTIYAGGRWSTAAVTQSSNMFYNCKKIMGCKGTTFDYSHIDAGYAHIDGGSSNPGYLSDNTPYAVYTPENTTLTFYYDRQRASRPGTSYDMNKNNYVPGWYSDGTRTNVSRVVFDPSFANARPKYLTSWFHNMENLLSITGIKDYLNTSEVTDMSYLFFNCSLLTSLDVSNFNTDNVTNMQGMFHGCTRLTDLDLSSFNTANVTNMQGMFYDCRGLTSLDISNFNTANVTDMGDMFYYCSGLTSLDVSNFNTANVTNMQDMFYYCSSLTNLDISNFNTANVTIMCNMFRNCSGLTNLDVSNFDTRKVIRMDDMFFDCSGLTSLDLSNYNTANVTYMHRMFNRCRNLTTITVGSNWNTDAVTSSTRMFYDCTKLVGGRGTTYDASHIDAEYAHLDGGPSNPGYFTAISKTGDVNGDAVVNITDVTTLLNALVNEDLNSIIEANADMNGDGVINITDVTMLVNLVLNSTR